jgi:hypothetical protein
MSDIEQAFQLFIWLQIDRQNTTEMGGSICGRVSRGWQPGGSRACVYLLPILPFLSYNAPGVLGTSHIHLHWVVVKG